MSVCPPIPKLDFNQAPYLVLWELTKACPLACRHCRAKAIRRPNSDELSTDEARVLLNQLRAFGKPLIVLTGGDPIQRKDIFEIISCARELGLTVAMTPSGTPSVNEDIVRQLKEAGIARLAISLDGPDAQMHDDFRRVQGSFAWSLNIVGWAKKYDLPVQINTTICRNNIDRFDDMALLVERLGAVLWGVFFLVVTGRASKDMQITANQAESVLKKMTLLAERGLFDVKSTAAPHFRRVLIEQYAEGNMTNGNQPLLSVNPSMSIGALRSYQSVNDGKGLIFISDTGDIYPSGFLPLKAGNVRQDNVVSIYREHELFKSLRDPRLLTGKCGACRYKSVCGGSRARAYGESGDYLAEDTLCSYFDPSMSEAGQSDGKKGN
jgi:radical SAM protein